jgi:hypothetical protein
MIQRALQLVLALFVSTGLSAQKEDAVSLQKIADDIMLNGKGI